MAVTEIVNEFLGWAQMIFIILMIYFLIKTIAGFVGGDKGEGNHGGSKKSAQSKSGREAASDGAEEEAEEKEVIQVREKILNPARGFVQNAAQEAEKIADGKTKTPKKSAKKVEKNLYDARYSMRQARTKLTGKKQRQLLRKLLPETEAIWQQAKTLSADPSDVNLAKKIADESWVLYDNLANFIEGEVTAEEREAVAGEHGGHGGAGTQEQAVRLRLLKVPFQHLALAKEIATFYLQEAQGNPPNNQIANLSPDEREKLFGKSVIAVPHFLHSTLHNFEGDEAAAAQELDNLAGEIRDFFDQYIGSNFRTTIDTRDFAIFIRNCTKLLNMMQYFVQHGTVPN